MHSTENIDGVIAFILGPLFTWQRLDCKLELAFVLGFTAGHTQPVAPTLFQALPLFTEPDSSLLHQPK